MSGGSGGGAKAVGNRGGGGVDSKRPVSPFAFVIVFSENEFGRGKVGKVGELGGFKLNSTH